MNAITLLYELDSLSGTMRLRPVDPLYCPFRSEEIAELERQLRPRYDALARGPGDRPVTLGDYEFHVKVQREGKGRHPALTLQLPWDSPPSTNGRPTGGEQRRLWPTPFFQELEALTQAAAEPGLMEQQALRFAVAELAQHAATAEAMLAPMLLAGYLMMAEGLTSGQDPARSSFYTLALRGLGRLLPEPPADGSPLAGFDFADRRTTGGTAHATSRLGRLLRRLLGFDGAVEYGD